MATTIYRLPSIPKQQTHMKAAKTNPWLDTVLSTESKEPKKPDQLPKSKISPKSAKPPDHLRPQSSASKPKTTKKPAESSLDEAFQAAIKAIVPERLEATRRAKAKTELSQGPSKDSPNVTKFTQVTSTNPTPTTQKLPKAKEKSLLQTAIEHLTVDRLHTVLYKALSESPKARSVFERELLVPPSPDPEDDQDAIAAKQKAGRKRSRFEVCRWCKGEFDVTQNHEDACNHHTGKLELNERARQYYDGSQDGTLPRSEKRERYLGGSTWDCCQADSDDHGCKTTAHEADDDNDYDLKRPRRY